MLTQSHQEVGQQLLKQPQVYAQKSRCPDEPLTAETLALLVLMDLGVVTVISFLLWAVG